MPDTNEPNTQAASTPEKEKKAPRTRKPRKAAAESAPAAAPAPAATPAEQATPPAEKKPARKRGRKPGPKPAAEAAPAPAEPAPILPAEPARTPEPPPFESGPEIEHPETPAPAPGFAAPETVGGNEGQGNGGHRKRRRRNRRGGGGDSAQQSASTVHPRVDADELKRRAWKIYLGEVTEEGLALMDDRTAAEAARRAYRVAELFLIEASHHLPAPAPTQPTPPTE